MTIHSQDVKDAESDAQEVARRYLVQSGWQRTSEGVPGSFVLWQRTLDDGRTVLANQSLAITMTPWIIDEPEQEGEEP